MAARNEAGPRRWALVVCVGLLAAAGCRQILGVEDPVPCESSAECALDGEPCVAAECVDGACTYSKIAAGSPAATDVPGDCSVSVCDDSGQATTQVDANDAPADDQAGDCAVPACDSEGAVTTSPAPDDVAIDMNPGDCRAPGCDAEGNPIDVDDPTDCTCEVGTPVPCYDGPAGTENEGPCSGGMADCEPGGELGVCTGQVLPAPDSCLTDAVDEDCSGANNECLGDHIWSWGFGGPNTEFPGLMGVVPTTDATAANTLTVVNFDQSVTIDDENPSGNGRNAVVVQIDGAGDPSVLAQFAVHAAGIRRSGEVFFVGGTLQDGQDETFGSPNTFSPEGDDGFIAAFNSEMLPIWVQTISSPANDRVFGFHQRPGGGVVVYGMMRGETTFDRNNPGGSTFPLVSFTGVNYFVAAYDSDGVFEWVTRWVSGIDVGSIDSLSSVAVAPGGDVFVCGSSDSNLSVTDSAGGSTMLHMNVDAQSDGFVFRLQAANGTTNTASIVKVISAGGGYDTCDSVAVLPDGGRVIAGAISGDVTYPNVTLNHTGSASVPDPYLLTMNQGGQPLDGVTFDMTANTARVLSVDAGPDGGIVAGGYFSQGTLNIAGTQYTCPAGRTDGFVVKFGSSVSAQPHWRKHLNKTGTNIAVVHAMQGQDLGVLIGGNMSGEFSAGGQDLDYVALSDVFYAKFSQ